MNFSNLRHFLIILGSVLVIAGGILLIYTGMIVFKTFNNPEQVQIVKFILDYVKIGDKAFFGSIGSTHFELNLGESMRTVLFVVIGVLILSILAGILKTLIICGIQIIKIGTFREKEEIEEETAEPVKMVRRSSKA